MQGTPLKYFMWPYQHYTRSDILRYAEELFAEFSPKLSPSVFLLGILRKDLEGRYPICIEPEDCGIDVDLFNNVDNLAASIFDKDPRKNMFYTVAHIQQLRTDGLKRSSLRSAIQQLVDKNFTGKNKVSFVSESVFLENYEIFVVLQFDESVYNSFYSLGKAKNKIRESFIDSLIWTFLDESLDTMYRPRAATYSQDILTDKKEVLRIAASDFVGSVIFAASESSGTWEFFNTCNYIASLKYEGDASIGQLIICKEDHPNIDVALKLTTPIGISQHRKVRKLLEIASKDLFLYSNGHEILGLARQKGTYDAKNEDLITINFSGSHKWELIHDTHVMMVVEHTNPSLPRLKINKEIFDDLLKRKFLKISEEDLEKLWNIVNTAIEQEHGTLLIISDKADQEAKRLEYQSTNIEPAMLTDDLIMNITSIDGAILLDSHGICHSIGVILDGIATNKGTSARGARFNSAVRYVEMKKNCVAIIISEDGMVDLYPQLLPRIRRSEIEKHLNELRNEVGLVNVDYDKYRPLMNWLHDHKFYLAQKECDEVNKLRDVFDSKLKPEPNLMYIIYPNLKPNPEMDGSYFMNEDMN